MSDLLTVDGLRVHFFARSGIAPVVDGIDFAIRPRETLGLVGESGSGKTMASLAVLRLVPPPARIVGGSMRFQDRDLLALDDAAMRGLRGKSIAMIFQNPAYSLNPDPDGRGSADRNPTLARGNFACCRARSRR